MKEILEVIKVYEITSEYIVAKVDMQVSSVDDLPAANEIVGNVKCGYGSIAQVIQSGVFYTMDDPGEWHIDNDASGGGGSSARLYTNSLAYMEEQMLPANMTAIYNTSVPYGSYGEKVAARLAISDEAQHTTLMEQGWSASGAAYYESENQIGAYGGYEFAEPTGLARASFWIGRFSGQNKALTVKIQYKSASDEWVDVETVEISPSTDYPLNIVAVDLTETAEAKGIRWIHSDVTKVSNTNIVFFGMTVYKRVGDAIPVYKPTGTGIITPPTGYAGFGALYIP